MNCSTPVTVFDKCARSVIDLCVIAGDRNRFVFRLLSDGDPWDTRGATVTAQARETAQTTTPALTATVTEVDASIGLWEVAWDGDAVRTLLGTAERWEGVWDLQVVEAGQSLGETPVGGAIGAVWDVTRA